MLTTYAVLDGFDLGAGILHLIEAKTDEERRTVLNAIGPVWDGNEVWLIAFGGVLYFAFPVVYASAFSGLYLPLMMVLWLLMLRGLGIELRRHFSHHMWWVFWDFVFSAASLGLTILFGAALGNIIRGFPIDKEGFFFVPLWTNFLPGDTPGAIDWFTLLFAASTVLVLSVHGAAYVAAKTDGDLEHRARAVAIRFWYWGTPIILAAGVSTFFVRPEFLGRFADAPWGILFPVAAIAAWVGVILLLGDHKDGRAFLSSCAFIASSGAAIAFAKFPVLLPAVDPQLSLTVSNSVTGTYEQGTGFIWFGIGMTLVLGYFVYLYITFRGKVRAEHRSHY